MKLVSINRYFTTARVFIDADKVTVKNMQSYNLFTRLLVFRNVCFMPRTGLIFAFMMIVNSLVIIRGNNF